MKLRLGLLVLVACLCAGAQSQPPQQQQSPPQQPPNPPAQTQTQPPSQQPPSTPPKQPPATPQRPANPFETVPEAPKPGEPQQQQPTTPRLEAPKPAANIPSQPNGQVIEAIEFRGARRVPQDTLRAMIFTKVGDIYNEDTLRRDFNQLWNSQRFDDITLETEPGTKGGVIVTFVVVERRVIRSINYEGIHTVTVSEILDRFKERKVGLVVESQYDPNKVQRAAIVLKEFEAERGRQYAIVEPVVEQIPPSSLKLTFNVKEGPKVKVGRITIVGNKSESQKWVIDAMKNLHPYGLPHSILFESVFPKTYDQAKLEEDMERIRQAYQDHGFFKATTLDETVKIVPRGGKGWRLPLIHMNDPGIYADITIPVEEGDLYHLHAMNYVGVKLFRTPEVLTRPMFGMSPANPNKPGDTGDVFSTDRLRKGIENLRKYYGMFGYIDFVPEPSFDFPSKGEVDVTLTADEGKQFFIRRIDFVGNTTTRDKVIRREILLDEGDMFNTNLWDLSILRLNQLGYFEVLKKEDAATITRNPGSNTIDLTLKVKERGKNSIGLNGGVSAIAGSFVGFNYSTNNFLGLGETLSLSSQLGTLMRNVTLGFTEPYFLDKPLQVGFTVYLSRFNFDQGREASLLAGYNLIPLYNQIGQQNLLNYVQNSYGFTTSISYPVRKSFTRLSLTYGYDISNIVTETNAATNYFQYINFSGVYGPNALNGIKTSKVTPGITYNTVDNPITPSQGKSLYASFSFAGSALGGNVNTLQPAFDAKYFKRAPWHKTHILAFHATTSLITGYGGKEVPPFQRNFIGGEQDIRGFEFFEVTPYAYIASQTTVNVYNSDGSQRMQKVVSGGMLQSLPVTMNIPTYQLITPGGDWQSVGNFEYRIPIVGPVQLALFADVGVNRILQPNQLKMDPTYVGQLNQSFPEAGFNGKVIIAPGTQAPRASTGLEIDVTLPVVQAPFRVYFAYNPLRVNTNLVPPMVADRAMFPNNQTFLNAISNNGFGNIFPFDERRTLFRFTIGRTF